MIGGGPEGGIFKIDRRRQDLDEADQGPAEGRHGPRGPGHRRPQDAGDASSRSSTPSATSRASTGRTTPAPRGRGSATCRRSAGAAARPAARPGGPAAAAAPRRRRGRRRRGGGGAAQAPGAAPQPRAAERRPRRLVPRRRRAYYHEIFVDPYRPDTIWSMNVNVERSTDGGRTWEPRQLGERPACTSITTRSSGTRPTSATSCSATTAASTRSYDEGATWRFFANLPDHAVLPRVGGQREAVLQRLRRHAGQLVALRPVAHAEPLGRPHERLVHRRAAATASRRATIPTIRTSSTRRRRTGT